MKAFEQLNSLISVQVMVKCCVCDSTVMDWGPAEDFVSDRIVEGWSVGRDGNVRCPNCKGKHAKH